MKLFKSRYETPRVRVNVRLSSPTRLRRLFEITPCAPDILEMSAIKQRRWWPHHLARHHGRLFFDETLYYRYFYNGEEVEYP